MLAVVFGERSVNGLESAIAGHRPMTILKQLAGKHQIRVLVSPILKDLLRVQLDKNLPRVELELARASRSDYGAITRAGITTPVITAEHSTESRDHSRLESFLEQEAV